MFARPLRRTAWVLVALCAGAVPAGAEEDLDARWQRLRKASMERVHELIAWCGTKKLFGCRADACEGVLTIAPDDPIARKWLKYRRANDGTWYRKGKWTRPRNLSKGQDKFEQRREELGEWYLREAAPILDEAEEEGAFRLRAKLIATALAVDPESATFRDWNHEVRDGDEWILLETRNARTRRKGLKETAEKAIEAVPKPSWVAARVEDKIGGVKWSAVLAVPRVRVLGTPPSAELAETLRFVDASWPVVEYAVGLRAPGYGASGKYAEAVTIYSFDSVLEGNRFYAKQPGVTARDVEFTAETCGSWLPGRDAAMAKAEDEATRHEAATTQVVSHHLARLLGLGVRHAWIAEGMGIYLTWQITGTRMLYSVNDVESKYAEKDKPIPEYEERMSDGKASWLALGRALLKSEDKPEVHLMTGKNFNDLTKPEVLYAYCVSAYVVEGWPEKAAAFLREAGGRDGNDLDLVCLKALGFDAATFEARLLRWLRETRRL